VIQTGRFATFLKIIFGQLSLPLEVELGSRYTLLIRVIGFLIAAATIGCYDDMMGSLFLPFLPPLMPFLVPLMVALVGAVQPPLATAPALPRTKAAPTASFPEACRVVMSSSTLVVSGCSWPSS
jgi:hypothetical protein